MGSGWGVDINIYTGLFCSCYTEQGRVKSDSLLFRNTIYILTQGCFGLVIWNKGVSNLTQGCFGPVIRNKGESNLTHCCSILQDQWSGMDVEGMWSGCGVDVEWMSCGCRVAVKWSSVGRQLECKWFSSGRQLNP